MQPTLNNWCTEFAVFLSHSALDTVVLKKTVCLQRKAVVTKAVNTKYGTLKYEVKISLLLEETKMMYTFDHPVSRRENIFLFYI